MRRGWAARPFTVVASYPDATGPVLAAAGHRVDCGLGNVAELAAKFPQPVRMAAHHALCPFAFQSYGSAEGELPPFLVEPDLADAEAILRSPWPLLPGQDMHRVTAATARVLFDALLGDVPTAINVPAPGGLPGGYPALASGLSVEARPALAARAGARGQRAGGPLGRHPADRRRTARSP